MNRRTALVTGAVAAVLATGAATAAAVPSLAASRSKTVAQHFTAESSSAPLVLSKTGYVLSDNDVKSGKTIGRDVLSCADAGTGASHCRVAFAEKGGLLYARFALTDSTGTLKGAVTGGTGSLAHAKGTLTGRAVSQKDVTITLHYTT